MNKIKLNKFQELVYSTLRNRKITYRTIICQDCKKEFLQPTFGQAPLRCVDCRIIYYKKYHKKYDGETRHRHRKMPPFYGWNNRPNRGMHTISKEASGKLGNPEKIKRLCKQYNFSDDVCDAIALDGVLLDNKLGIME